MEIDLPIKIEKEMSGTIKDYGYKSEKDFIADALRRRLLELRKTEFLVGAAEIRKKMEEKKLTEKEILEDFENFYHR